MQILRTLAIITAMIALILAADWSETLGQVTGLFAAAACALNIIVPLIERRPRRN